jgi:hypothetical protein
MEGQSSMMGIADVVGCMMSVSRLREAAA